MKALIQRVQRASVSVDEKIIGEINQGILGFIGIENNDTEVKADRLIQRILNYRIFPDHENKMNRSLIDIQGGLLLVSQFTLVADTKKGLRPSFSSAASPEISEILFNHILHYAKSQHNVVASGQFGANMQIELINDGPVTFILEV